jgi:3-dehydroquinate dehydratase-2
VSGSLHVGVLNGPNLNRLGKRKPQYGTRTLADITADLETTAARLGVRLSHFQSNYEGALVEWLHEHWEELDAVILNPAGLTPCGRPLLDALLDAELPVAVVHISQLYRHYGDDTLDLFRATADVYVCGLAWRGYSMSLERLHELREAQMLQNASQDPS